MNRRTPLAQETGQADSEQPAVQPKPAATDLVKPVVNTINILKLLAKAATPLKLTAIATTLKINPSTCLGILRTLVAMRLIEQDADSKGYTVGIDLVSLADGLSGHAGSPELYRAAMARIAWQYSVTVVLWRVVSEDHLRLASLGLSDADVRIQLRIGQRLPSWAGAIGRLMAGYSGLPESALREKFAGVRWQSPPSFERYLRESQEAKRLGYGIDDSCFVTGVQSMAAPIFDGTGKMSMAVVAVMFSGQHSPATLRQLSRDLKSLAGTPAGRHPAA